jgi:hypothetical protein
VSVNQAAIAAHIRAWLPTAIAAIILGVSDSAIRKGIIRRSNRYAWREANGGLRGGKSGKTYEILTELPPDCYDELCVQYGREFEIETTEETNEGNKRGRSVLGESRQDHRSPTGNNRVEIRPLRGGMGEKEGLGSQRLNGTATKRITTLLCAQRKQIDQRSSTDAERPVGYLQSHPRARGRNQNEAEGIIDDADGVVKNTSGAEIAIQSVLTQTLSALPPLELRDGKPTENDKAALVESYETLKREGRTLKTILGMFAYRYGLTIRKSTLYDWRTRFADGGLKTLVDRRGGNRKNIDDECLAAALKNSAGAHYTTALKEYKLALRVKYEDNPKALTAIAPITQSGFNRAAKRLIKEGGVVSLLLRGGKDRAVRELSPSVPREKVARGYEYQMDATKLDYAVVKTIRVWDDTLNRLTETTKVTRATMIVIVDHYSSRFVAGLYDSPNSYANVRLLKKAILTMGAPRILRMDNGSDYKSKHFQDAVRELGIIAQFGRKYRGDDKGTVERINKTIQDYAEDRPGYLGHNLTQRELREKMACYKSERLSGAATNIKNLMTWEQFDAQIDIITDEICANNGYIAAWEQAPGEIKIIPEEDINRALGKRYERRFGKQGVTVDKLYYQSLDARLAAYRGQMVEVVEDIDDVRRVWLYDLKTKEHIGTATNAKLLGYTKEEKRAIERAIDKAAKAKIRGVERLGEQIDGLKPYVKQANALLEQRKREATMKKEQEAPIEAANASIDRLTERMLKLERKIG